MVRSACGCGGGFGLGFRFFGFALQTFTRLRWPWTRLVTILHRAPADARAGAPVLADITSAVAATRTAAITTPRIAPDNDRGSGFPQSRRRPNRGYTALAARM